MSSTKFHIKRVQGERIIYTASLFAKQNLFYLQEIGYSQYLEPYISKRGELAYYFHGILKMSLSYVQQQITTIISGVFGIMERLFLSVGKFQQIF